MRFEQIRLLIMLIVVIDSHRTMRHRRRRINNQMLENTLPPIDPYKRDKSPCDMPAITDANFEDECQSYFKKKYICALSEHNKFTLSAVEEYENIMSGYMAYCYYNPITSMTEETTLEGAKSKNKYDLGQQRKIKTSHNNDRIMERSKSSEETELIMPVEMRPKIGITIVDMLDFHRSFNNESCNRQYHYNRLDQEFANATAYKSTLLYPDKMTSDRYQALKHFYADLVRLKWSELGRGSNLYYTRSDSQDRCITDIAILIILSSPSPYPEASAAESRVSAPVHYDHIVVSISNKFQEILNETHIRLLANSLSTPVNERLKILVTEIVTETKDNYEMTRDKPHYSVPDWAFYTMIACVIISLSAAGIGHWISNKSSSRSSGASALVRERGSKWAAGFAGGVWGAT